MGKFSNFQNFAANSKMFENFPANFKKNVRKLTHSAPYMYTRSTLGGALQISLKFKKKLNFVLPQLTRSARACMRYG
jgi:hypothetical protein